MAVTITSPAPGASISGTITITATADGGTLQRAALYIDGAYIDSTTAEPITFTLDTTTLTDGSHEIKVSADYSSESATAAATVNNGGPGSVYWGAAMEGPQTYGTYYSSPAPNGQSWQTAPWGHQGNTLDRFEQNAGKKASLVLWSQPPPWKQSKFYPSVGDIIVNRGAIPLLSMNTGNEKLRDLANGKYDAVWKTWCDQVKAYGKPMLFRINWEMNGNWFAWGQAQPAADYIAFWQHYYDLAKQRGANNLTWVWCANVNPAAYPYEPRYPGDAYVDWAGLDGYNKKTTSRPFTETFATAYAKLQQMCPSKPIVICEFSSREYGGTVKGDWIADALNSALPQNFPKIRAICWFNWRFYESNAWQPYPIESTPAAQAAFKSSIANQRYIAAGQKSLPPGQKVPVPS